MPSTPSTPTILVVDDDQGLLILIECALRAEEWNVVTTHSGADALAWLLKNSADLLLLDLKLGDVEGRELIGILADAGRSVPFIVITGQGDERVAVEMMKRGALDYLVKDVNFVELVPVVRRALVRLADQKRLAEAEKAAIESRLLTQAVLNSLTAHIAVLDQQGNIIAVNEPWKRFAQENGDPAFVRTGVGVNYLEICRRSIEDRQPGATEILAGIQAVIERSKTNFSVEYPCHSPGKERWFVITVTPLTREGGGVVVSHTDITQRKQAEESLRRKEAELNEAQRIALIGSWYWDVKTNVITGSDELHRIFGLDPATQRVPAFQEQEGRLYPAESWHQLKAAIQKTMQTGAGFELDVKATSASAPTWVISRRNEAPMWVTSRSEALRNAQGEIVGLRGTIQDVTERKRGELRWRLQYETARLLAASNSLAETIPKLLQILAEALGWDLGELWDVDAESNKLRVIYAWNAPGRKLAAFVKHSLTLSVALFEDMPGRVLSTRQPDWIPEIAQCPHFSRKRAAAKAGLRSALAFPIQVGTRTIGVMAFLADRSKELDEDLLQLFVSLGSQIGQFIERKRGEEALREANEFSKQVMGGAQAGIIVYDREGKLLVWNPFMEQITGYRTEEVRGRLALEVFPFLREQHFEKMFERAVVGQVFEAADIRFDLPEKGRAGWFAARFAPLRNARQEIVGVIVAVRDITERRRMEAELLESTEREQRRIGRDLHDGLAQQLTAMEMKSFLLMEDFAAGDFAVNRERLQEQARQMGQALRECVTVTRSLASSLAPVNVEAGGLMAALQQLADTTHMAGKVACRFDCQGPVMLDNSQIAGHLYRIALEAVNNALERVRTRHIQISLAHEQGVLRLQIKDDRRGLSLSKESKLGMGLEVMRHRAHVIGASLEIESKSGQGVIVTCILPLENRGH